MADFKRKDIRTYARPSSLKNKGSGVVSPELKATKNGPSLQKGSKARGSTAERGTDKGRKEEETAGGTKRLKTAEETKQNKDLMDGVVRTTEAAGGATGDQEKLPAKVSFANPATGIQIREMSKAAKKIITTTGSTTGSCTSSDRKQRKRTTPESSNTNRRRPR